jgi:hypothetical protein
MTLDELMVEWDAACEGGFWGYAVIQGPITKHPRSYSKSYLDDYSAKTAYKSGKLQYSESNIVLSRATPNKYWLSIAGWRTWGYG